MFVLRFTLGFNTRDSKTITSGTAMNNENPNNDPCVTVNGPIFPAIISTITPGLCLDIYPFFLLLKGLLFLHPLPEEDVIILQKQVFLFLML